MTKLLFIAYHFPPVGGGGVQRNAKFARYLPGHGFDLTVITGPGRSSDRWAPDDATLISEVQGAAKILRVDGPEPEQTGLRASLEWKLLLRSAHARWWTDSVVRLGTQVAREVDLIYASLIPYETAQAAAELSRRLGKPWVADLQDPWALDEMWLYPTSAHRAADRRRMRRLLSTAAAIVMNTPEAATRLLKAFPELQSRVVVSIPNGFDASDFAAPPPAAPTGRFRIAHAGYLHTDHGIRLRRTRRLRRFLGGTAPVDILPRSHVYLLRALDELAAESPEIAGGVEVVLAGVTTELDREIARSSTVEVRMPGYMSHADTIALLRSSHLLFLPMHDLPGGMRAGLVPGKTYEYLASRTPILAAVPNGDARDLLEQAGSASLCRPTDHRAMARILETQITRWQRNAPPPPLRESVLAPYERLELTRQLVDVFHAVLSRGDEEIVTASAV